MECLWDCRSRIWVACEGCVSVWRAIDSEVRGTESDLPQLPPVRPRNSLVDGFHRKRWKLCPEVSFSSGLPESFSAILVASLLVLVLLLHSRRRRPSLLAASFVFSSRGFPYERNSSPWQVRHTVKKEIERKGEIGENQRRAHNCTQASEIGESERARKEERKTQAAAVEAAAAVQQG